MLVLLVGLFLAGGAVAVPSVASAQEYPPQAPTGSVSSGTVGTNGSVTFSGKSTPFDTVTVTVTYASGESDPPRTVTADADGNWSLVVSLSHAGVATLTAVTALGTVTQQVVVRSASSSGSDQLATTGIANGKLPMLALLGSVIVLLGATLILTGVRRRNRAASAK
ncbi:hypothetical protein [Dactylosporangium sp. CA-092794]|uniref:hypothetical protein n=1 Tax=Dactylosporangium sp. CA-092794 TaxID=3239929 RepID=UPI003D8A8269